MAIEISTPEIMPYDDFPIPETLYKYRDWSNNFHKKLISHKELFFAQPSSFEDKFDCKNPIRWDLLTSEEILNKYFQESHKTHPHLTPEGRMDFAIDWANHTMVKNKEYIAEEERKSFKMFNSYIGVLSLTEYPSEMRMWDKYSREHTGFCVGFDAKTMLRGIGSGGGKVLYHKELPIIHPVNHSNIQQAILQIFNKFQEWEFEKEYRSYKFRNYSLSLHDRTVVVPSTAFNEIILGVNMSKRNEDLLLASIPKDLQHVKIKKAYIENNDVVLVNDYI